MSTESKFKELQEQGRKVLEGAIQVNAKIESAEDSYQRLLPSLLEKYQVQNEKELLELLDLWEKENEENYRVAYNDFEVLAKQVQERKASIVEIQNASK